LWSIDLRIKHRLTFHLGRGVLDPHLPNADRDLAVPRCDLIKLRGQAPMARKSKAAGFLLVTGSACVESYRAWFNEGRVTPDWDMQGQAGCMGQLAAGGYATSPTRLL
jgi:hypothetical protein